ncbi:ArsR family transcriptional regulator [Vibrio sp. T187]|uniref:ArsR/SmtB family transcription factor n=1 Tax=Vibrio TaxID=662 RepID=UPI0010C9E798|nr:MULTISPECIES: winged helix-turn-helix domain-containing protein [Vibrio]MBW3695668.1 ArsR family transcriptional regulator [Vibrio sp. T187]
MTTSCKADHCIDFSATESQLAQEAEFASLAKALSHPARVRILKILITLDNSDGCLNSDLVSELNLAQSTVSEHLRILKQSGFITAEPIPPKMCYRVNRDRLNDVSNLFSHLFN